MKIKIILALLLMCLPLCGCSEEKLVKADNYEEQAEKWEIDKEKAKIIDEYNDLFVVTPSTQEGNYVQGRLSKKVFECLESDFTQLGGIEYTQHSNGRAVKVYESKKIRGCYVLYDGEWIKCLPPDCAIGKDSKALFESLSHTDLVARENPVSRGGVEIIRCDNKEYTLADFQGNTMFSIQYPDVDVKTEVCPVRALVFSREGKPYRVELITPQTEGLPKPNEINQKQVKELLDTLGLGDESADLAEEYITSLDKKDYTYNEGSVSVSSNKNVAMQRDIAYNRFAIEF